MIPYIVKTPKFVQWIFPKRIWAFSNKNNAIYLTFDDGPIPEVTPWVLSELKKHKAKATFFCIGDNIKKHPDIFQKVKSEGHTIANHTFNHLNGARTKTSDYIKNVLEAEAQIESTQSSFAHRKSLFRPPYGRLTPGQAKKLRKEGYSIIMWDVLSGDFDATISEEKCLQNVLKNIRPGSIVIFHDSIKAKKNLQYTLPKVLQYCIQKNWLCKAI
ncbi:peptidoglycan/xylan/chitin deacetylase (PgdA/CDA1 family) [Ulvibacter sp. MAR_2010_11]|uniref:polysaccharide deacetylase family protein n=1 Tax=Ulvibacter sp. MAR_2010_11 TaxID=1250229 RepID=UPI000C2CCE86|nr:polysaccharide deacetylase family protein [Ulvibacter sp. MAR_2010_11]PKA83216.1 peptidoglycan/xylan/chitin deacetylase (PgdA/CDA1 family) [Ulvibacter sp. MAR_2010_11]